MKVDNFVPFGKPQSGTLIIHSCMGIRYAKLFEAAKSMFKS